MTTTEETTVSTTTCNQGTDREGFYCPRCHVCHQSDTPKRYQVTSRTVQVGDVLALGYGTLNITHHEVTEVDRWYHNGYCNARLTFADGESWTLYADRYIPLA